MSCNWLQGTACIQSVFVMPPAGILVIFGLYRTSAEALRKMDSENLIITHFKDRLEAKELGIHFIIVS